MEIAPRDGALIPGITAFAEGPEETREVVRAHIEKIGVDVVKLSMSGEEITEHLRAEDTTFEDESVAAAVEEAHRLGARVCSHARSDDSIMQCLQYGVDMVCAAVDGSLTDANLGTDLSCQFHLGCDYGRPRSAKGSSLRVGFVFTSTAFHAHLYICSAPAINWLYATLNDAAAFGYPQPKADSVGYKRELEIAIAGLKEMHRRGIRILPGGDYGLVVPSLPSPSTSIQLIFTALHGHRMVHTVIPSSSSSSSGCLPWTSSSHLQR